MTLRLREMTTADVPDLLPLERDLFGAEGWSAEVFRSELAESGSRFYLLALDDGKVVGYGGLCVYPDDAWVQTLAVRRERWGRGVGGALLRALLAEAVRRDRTTVSLEVRADNARAQELYRRHGFRDIATRRHYYQPSNVDALVMQRGPGE